MALLKSITLKDNFDEEITFANAYHKVVIITGGKDQLGFQVQAFKSAETTRPVSTKEYVFKPDLTGSNFIAQCYDYLKTLPDYDKALDC